MDEGDDDPIGREREPEPEVVMKPTHTMPTGNPGEWSVEQVQDYVVLKSANTARQPDNPDFNERAPLTNDPNLQEWLKHQDFETQVQFGDFMKKEYEYSDDTQIKRVKGTATPDYVCHDFAWSGGKTTAPPGGHIDPTPVIKNPTSYGYEKLPGGAQIQPGDIVVYHKNDPLQAVHSGLVTGVDGNTVKMRSKDGSDSLFDHQLVNQDGSPSYFMTKHAKSSEGGYDVYRPGPGAKVPTKP